MTTATTIVTELQLTKLTKNTVRYDVSESDNVLGDASITSLYVQKSALADHYRAEGEFPQTVSVEITIV